MKKILILNGPNLNLLGKRQPAIYGSKPLADIQEDLTTMAHKLGCMIEFFQSNHEGTLIDRLHALLSEKIHFIIINPGAFTHTSIALRDAMLAVNLPFIEIHLSNIYAREPFRKHSYFSDIAEGVISGLGTEGYFAALRYACAKCTENIPS